MRDALSNTLGVELTDDPGSYLGMPLIIRRNRTAAFGYLRDKVATRVQGWTKNMLSYGGRAVFVTSVGQALPTYTMGCFLIPDGIAHEISTILRSYWWLGDLGNQDVYLDNPENPIRVGDFMVTNEPRWNEILIREVFTVDDPSTIMRTMIAPIQLDLIVWASHSSVERRIFLTGIADGLCSLYGQHEETVLHALRECSEVRPLFQVAGLPSLLTAGEFDSCGSWLESILILTDANTFTYFIIILSQIWHRMNVLVHEGRLLSGWFSDSGSGCPRLEGYGARWEGEPFRLFPGFHAC
ncbi:hypothetical protein F3Y22_tig00111833pilonHSYRG00022 [Hibiscus syriacus]|uniref:Uncharacterized protein n=1 Tax=Hibiscus syriacus TaxID=106335 RepID=A0A6A2Y816_HIBSY|nr:hypothetical protein F3Y22_tig00111833pilonHSYRG00022 [Hibiscus syriacus]